MKMENFGSASKILCYNLKLDLGIMGCRDIMYEIWVGSNVIDTNNYLAAIKGSTTELYVPYQAHSWV